MFTSRIGDIENSTLLATEFDLPEEQEIQPDSTNLYREASIIFWSKMTGAIQFLRNASSTQELLMRLDIVSYVFLHPSVRDHSLTALARRHNKTRAAISAEILNFQRANNLGPTLAQKSTESRQSYTQSRISKLK